MPDLLSGLPFGPFTRMEEVSFFSGLFKSLTSATHTHASVDLPGHCYARVCVCVHQLNCQTTEKKTKCRREIVEQQRQLCCSSGICSSLGYSAGKSDRGRIGSKEGELYRIYIYIVVYCWSGPKGRSACAPNCDALGSGLQMYVNRVRESR